MHVLIYANSDRNKIKDKFFQISGSVFFELIYDKNKTCIDCKYFCESDGFGYKNRWITYEDDCICEDFIEKQ